MQHSIHPVHLPDLTLASEQGCNFGKCRSLHLHQKQDRSTEWFFVTPEPQAGELLALYHQVVRSLCTPVFLWLTWRHITYLMLCQAQSCLQEGSSLHCWKYSSWAASRQSNSSCGFPQVARQAAASHQAGVICCWLKQLLLKTSWENSIWAMELQAGDLVYTSGWGNNNWGAG